jgi:hypothetical protein
MSLANQTPARYKLRTGGMEMLGPTIAELKEIMEKKRTAWMIAFDDYQNAGREYGAAEMDDREEREREQKAKESAMANSLNT